MSKKTKKNSNVKKGNAPMKRNNTAKRNNTKNTQTKKWYWMGGAAAIAIVIAFVIGWFALSDNQNDFVVARVNGTEVFASDVNANISQAENMLMWDYFDMFPDDWDIDYDRIFRNGLTFGRALREEAVRIAAFNIVVEDYAQQLGVTLSADDWFMIDDYMESLVWQFGGERELREALLEAGFRDEAHLAELYASEILLENLIQAIIAIPHEFAQFEQYMPPEATPPELLGAKHILANFDNFETEEEAEAFAYEILTRLEAGEDFYALMHEYSQDFGGLWDFPNGYSFASGDMVPEFEQATRELEMGEVSGLVRSGFGIHIIMRIEPNEADWHLFRNTQPVTLESRMMEAVFIGLEAMAGNAVIEFLPELDRISVGT